MAKFLLISAFLASCLVAVNAGYGYGAPEVKVAAYGYEAPLLKKPIIPIIRLIENSDGYGNYNLDSESADGTRTSETGAMKVIDGQLGSVKSGSYSWISPEGIPFSLSYTADENGFRPVASHLPVPPPVPAEIQTMLRTLPAADYNEHILLRESPYSAPAPVVRFAEPAFSPLALPDAPVKTFVSTPEFLIDSAPSKTVVKIGQY
jgi:hypothetical protein